MHRSLVDIDFSAEFGPEAQLFDFEVCAHNPQFFFNLDERPLRVQQVSENVGKIENQTAGISVRPINSAIKRVQRIEQEVRIYLGLQSLELRLGDKALHLNASQLFN